MDIWRHVWKRKGEWKELINERVEGWQGMESNVRVAIVMNRVCRDAAFGRAMDRMHAFYNSTTHCFVCIHTVSINEL